MDKVSGSDITIAVTVYDRRQYIRDAIQSALCQRTPNPPKVIVVEDCGPDPTLRQSVIEEFGDQIQYFRNQRRRGLFDNWNVCIETCRTPWLCILHDDDFLDPTFVESMIELVNAAPNRALYWGEWNVVDATGAYMERASPATSFSWREPSLEAWAEHNPVCFAGQLFNVACARSIGGFRASSRYSADWEMWCKLALNYGAAATNRVVANFREYHSIGRGTTKVDISGRKYAYVNMQRKRHFGWLRQEGHEVRFDRQVLFKESPLPSRFILSYGHAFSPLMLRYNAGLLLISTAPHMGYRILQLITQLFSWRVLRWISSVFNLLPAGAASRRKS